MSSPGLADFLPIPDNIDIVTDPGKREESRALGEEPTASHALAVADHDEKGAVQQSDINEVTDLGWNDPKEKISDPLVGGLPNDELWVLIRRFNKQMYHVKEYPYPVPGNLDLNIAEEEEFSPDKLRANIERLYMTVIIGLMTFGKHIVRLRSWREARRTACFCTAYFVASIFDFLVPLFSLTLVILIAYPPSRSMLFPPAPLALVSAKTGGVQKPKAGVLGSHDSATGAPENFKGEAVEAEASNFVNGIASVALSSAAGKHPQNDPPTKEGDAPTASVPDPTAMAMGAADARKAAGGNDTGVQHDKTKVPMETATWNQMRPVMHSIADVSDTWERFGNALSPTPPFPQEVYRLRLAAVIVPLLAMSVFVTSYLFVKCIAFGVGFGFFGDPVIQPGLKWLNATFPNWQKLLELRNTLLKGVPTNAQLTITMLRIGEANKAPLPPPPYSGAPPPDEPAKVSEEHLRATGADSPLNATDDELKEAMEPDESTAHENAGPDIAASKEKTHGKKGAKILGMFKSGVKGSIETTLGADRFKAKVGSEHAKHRLGVIPKKGGNRLTQGPIEFKCRYHGKRGNAYISTRATIPCVSFSLDQSIVQKGTEHRGDDELRPVWSVAVADIRELKKVGGLGWKAKLVVGWALDREVADGIEIVDKQGGGWVLTAMVSRDELFNRLVAMGGQKWEAW